MFSAAYRPGPGISLDFKRVLNLPRRDWESYPDLESETHALTDALSTPNGTMKLRQVQAAALLDLFQARGLFAPIGVGEGKSLITLLAPIVCDAKRPVLFVPASVRDQTLRYVIPQMSNHWEMHPNLKVVGYSELSLAKNADMLETIAPDMIIADECHALKAWRTGRTKRVTRYMRANPSTTFVALSGTVTNHSIMDYWQILQWCFGANHMPLPNTYHGAVEWAEALDERIRNPLDRRPPGALELFCKESENHREGYRRRLTETPGVLATRNNTLGTSLILSERKIKTPRSVLDLMQSVESYWETPSGEIISEATELHRTLKALSCGFFYKWDPLPPSDWLQARKEWKQFVRQTLQTNRRKLDTELQVWNECRLAERPPSVWSEWSRLRETFKPNPVAEWVDYFLVEDATRWLLENDRAICWVDHVPVGHAIAKASGVKYYGAGDDSILEASGRAVASIRAHGTGKNLQMFDTNLVVAPPTSGKVWEQLLGRTHRLGQSSDEVVAEVYQHTRACRSAMQQAVLDAEFLRDTLGNNQKLLYCTNTLEGYASEENDRGMGRRLSA